MAFLCTSPRRRRCGLLAVALLGSACERDDDTLSGALDAAVLLDAEPSQTPQQPARFSIELTVVHTFAPKESIELHQDGQIIHRPCGDDDVVLRTSIAEAEARSIYTALLNAGYWTLADRYVDQGEHCPVQTTDFGSSRWRVEADGTAKGVDRYDGCFQSLDENRPNLLERIPELEELDALVPIILNLVRLDGGAHICPERSE